MLNPKSLLKLSGDKRLQDLSIKVAIFDFINRILIQIKLNPRYKLYIKKPSSINTEPSILSQKHICNGIPPTIADI